MKIFSLVALAAIATIASVDVAATPTTSPVTETPIPTTAITPAPTTPAPATTAASTTMATPTPTPPPTSTTTASAVSTPTPTTAATSQTPATPAPVPTTQAPTSSVAPPPVPTPTEPASTTPVVTPNTTEPTTTTPAPNTTEPVTMTPAPNTTEPVTTTPAPNTTEPVTMTPAPNTTEPVTATPAPNTTEPVTMTPAPNTTEPVTATPAPNTTEPVTTTPVPNTTEPVTATPAPNTTEPVTTTPAPTSTDPATPTPTPTPTPTSILTPSPTTTPTRAPTPSPTTRAPTSLPPTASSTTRVPTTAAPARTTAPAQPKPTQRAPSARPPVTRAPVTPPATTSAPRPVTQAPTQAPTPPPVTLRPLTPPPTVPPTPRPVAQVRLGVVGGNASMVVDSPVLFKCYDIYELNQCPASGFDTVGISNLNYIVNASTYGSTTSLIAFTRAGCNMDNFLTMSRDDQTLTISRGTIKSFIIQAGPTYMLTDYAFGNCSILPTTLAPPTPAPTTSMTPAPTPRPPVQVKLGLTGSSASMVLNNPVLYTCYNIYELNNCPGSGFDSISNENISFTPGANLTGLNVRIRLFTGQSCNRDNAFGINIDGQNRTVVGGKIKSFVVDDGAGGVTNFAFGQCTAPPTPPPTEPPSLAPGLPSAQVDIRMTLWGDVVVVNEPVLNVCYNIDQCSSAAGINFNVMTSRGLVQAAGSDVRVRLFTGRGCNPSDLGIDGSPDVEIRGGRVLYKSFVVQTTSNAAVTNNVNAFCTWTLAPIPPPTSAPPVTTGPPTPVPTTPVPTTPAPMTATPTPTTPAPTGPVIPAQVTILTRTGGDPVVVHAPVLHTCYNVACPSVFGRVNNTNLFNSVGAAGASDLRVAVYSAPGCLGRNSIGLMPADKTVTLPDAVGNIQSFSVQPFANIFIDRTVDVPCPVSTLDTLAPLLSAVSVTSEPSPTPTTLAPRPTTSFSIARTNVTSAPTAPAS